VTEDTDEPAKISELLDAGDLGGAVAKLRCVADRVPLPEVLAYRATTR
jgi:hypothetical protein